MGNFVYIQEEKLNAFCQDAFEGFGFSPEEASIIKDVLMMSDMYGIQSHGMQRVVRYHKGIEKGLIDIKAKPEVVFETPVSAVVEGHDAMGQLVGHFAMELAIKKAKESGIGIVSARNSNHYGIAGYYADQSVSLALTLKQSWFLHLLVKQCLVPTQLRSQCLLNHTISSSTLLQQ